MHPYETLKVVQEGNVVTAFLDRSDAHNAINMCASTGKSPAFLLRKDDSAAPYLRKLPAIQ